MTVSIPESVTAEGNVCAYFVPTVADLSAVTTAEITAGTNISCFLMPEWDGAQATQNSGESRRFCSKEGFSRLGRTAWSIAPLQYTYLPQELGTGGNAANAVYEALTEDTTGYVLLFYGLAGDSTPASGDVYDGFPVECGVQVKDARGSDEFAPLTVTQTLGVTGTPELDATVAA